MNMSLRSHQKKDRIVFMDFETTGLNIFQNEIIEVAMCDNFGHRYESLIKIDSKLPDNIQRITRITSELLETQGKPMDTVIRNVCDFIHGNLSFLYNGPCQVNSASFVVGHNLFQFDMPILQAHIHRCNIANKKKGVSRYCLPSPIRIIDTLLLAQKNYMIADDPTQPYRRKYSLECLTETLGLKNKPTHRAMSDVLATIELFDTIRNELQQRGRQYDLLELFKDTMRYHTKV